jgi:serine/threonine protein kinase
MPRRARASADGADVRGRRLAHFELIEPIGVGGMAAVIRARDTQLDRQVALKILPPEMAKDAENVQRFHQEARSAARLDHENIARVFFCGEDQTLHFIAFEFVEGENLRTILERRGRLPVEEALHYVLQVAAGLAHAGQRGVVHRDIKPSNIIITPSGRAKLVDMGLARSLEPQHDLGLTQSGVTLGTFDYISPEQALEPRDVDVRSDIYSLGCTFYHMLTGQPPVPDGTAAKKLHHHQYVRPLDPRQYVPDLPYEVAAILDRMMAKLPKNRYQTPEELVHQLLLAGKKIGAVPDVPEGVLSVEMTLPKPPGTRPLLVAGLAALTVVILVTLLGKGEPGGNPFSGIIKPQSNKPSEAAKSGPGGATEVVEVPPAKDRSPSPKEKEPKRSKEVTFESKDGNVAELARWLADNKGADKIEIVLEHDLLMSSTDPALVAEAREVVIRGKDKGRRPMIRLTYLPSPGESRQAALTVRAADTSTLSGLGVVVAGQRAAVEMVGVLFQGGRSHRVEACEFIQVFPSFDEKNRLASVAAEAMGSRPNLTFEGCCFLGYGEEVRQSSPDEDAAVVLTGAKTGGQDAVVRRGPVKVTAANCAFGPHRAAFRLEDQGGEPLEVRHCSVLAYAAPSAVFHLTPGGSAALDVRDSLFSRLGGPRGSMDAMNDPERVALVRQANPSDTLSYNDVLNRYHNFDDYWVTGEGETGWMAFQDKVSQDRKQRDESKELKGESPWKGEPLALLEKQPVTAAFQINPEAAGLLTNGTFVGAYRLLGVEYPRPQPRPAPLRELVVNPDGADDSANRRYKRLEQAVEAAESGDVILLQHNGDLPVKKPVVLEKENFELTIRAADGYRPRLTLAGAANKDTSLFRLQGSRLRLEGLDFLLQPDQDEFDSQAVVVIAGGGQCEFKDCLATLNPDRRKAALSLATLIAAPGAMRPDVQRPGVSLDHCIVRGDGDLVWDRTGRPASLKADNTLVALGGSLLNLDSREEGADKRAVELNLTRVTAYLGGYLIRMQVQSGRDLKGLTPVECRPDHCLFLPATAERTLIHLDGPADKDELLQKKLTWEKKNPNAYGNFQSMFDQQTPDGMHTTPAGMGQDRWKQFTGEGTNSKYGVRLAAGPIADSPFPQLTPSQFKLMDANLKDFGADLASLGRLVPEAKDEE